MFLHLTRKLEQQYYTQENIGELYFHRFYIYNELFHK